MIKNLEIKTYECCGIPVTVKMDYQTGNISLVESSQVNPGMYNKKSYIFVERPAEFAAEKWIEILCAIKYAIETATKEMLDYKAEKQKEAESTVCEMLDIATAMVKSKRDEPKKKGFFSKRK